MLGGTSIGDMLSGGLRDLVDAFKQKGQGEVADSWVSRGPNKQIAPHQLEQAIGPDVLETLSQQTGLSREELLSRPSKNLSKTAWQRGFQRNLDSYCRVVTELATRHSITSSAAACRTSGIAVPSSGILRGGRTGGLGGSSVHSGFGRGRGNGTAARSATVLCMDGIIG
jgi:hypothetical protein